MERFGRETNIPIVGPAKVASAVRSTANFVGKALPWTIGAGGGGYFLAKKLLGQQQGYSNNPY